MASAWVATPETAALSQPDMGPGTFSQASPSVYNSIQPSSPAYQSQAPLQGSNSGVGHSIQINVGNPSPTAAVTNKDPHINPATGQWDDNYYATHSQAKQQPDLDAIYNPAMSALDQQAATLQSTLVPSMNSQIDANAQQARGNLDTQQQAYDTTYNQDQNQLGQERLQANAQATNDYASLMQRYNAMFGGQSSAAGAATELANQEYLKTSGGIQQSYANGLSDLLGKHSQYMLFLNQQKSQIDTDVSNMKKQVQDQMAQELFGINQNKAMLESAKASAKANLLQDAINQQKQIDLYGVQKSIDLQAWAQQQNTSLSNQAQQLAQQHAQFLSTNPFAGQQMDMSQPQQGQQQQNSSQQSPFLFSSQQQQKDPFSNLIG